jgi:hypothetical protein
MDLTQIKDEFTRELDRPYIYLPNELVIAEARRAVRETANQVDTWWIRFDKLLTANNRWYKIDKVSANFEILDVRLACINEINKLIPKDIEFLIPNTQIAQPKEYGWLNDDNVPIFIFSPTPNQSCTVNIFCKGISPVTNMGEIPLPMFMHNAVAHYTKYLLYKIFSRANPALKQDAIESKQDWALAIGKINEDHADKLPFKENEMGTIWVDIDSGSYYP